MPNATRQQSAAEKRNGDVAAIEQVSGAVACSAPNNLHWEKCHAYDPCCNLRLPLVWVDWLMPNKCRNQ